VIRSIVPLIDGKHPRVYSGTGGKFPVTDGTICYWAIAEDGTMTWIDNHEHLAHWLQRAVRGEVSVFAVWPGKYRSDMFYIDDPEKFAEDVLSADPVSSTIGSWTSASVTPPLRPRKVPTKSSPGMVDYE